MAVTTATRASAMPELPTVAESGVPGYETGAWYGLLGPIGIPPAIVAKLNAEVVRIAALPAIREKLVALGGEPAAGTSEQFAERIKREIARFRAVAKAANMKPE